MCIDCLKSILMDYNNPDQHNFPNAKNRISKYEMYQKRIRIIHNSFCIVYRIFILILEF